MARKRKRDFWDDVEDDVISQEESERESYSAREQGGYTEDYEDEGFRLTRCMPAKIIARILLCAAAVVIVVCGLIFYRYVDDRQANGTYTTSYFDSNGFSREYNDAVERLLEALQAIEAEGNITTERAAELASGIMGTNTNFSYYIMDEAGNVIVESGDDARDRIEGEQPFHEDCQYQRRAGSGEWRSDNRAEQKCLADCSRRVYQRLSDLYRSRQ